MATVLPPPTKKQKLAEETSKREAEEAAKIPEGLGNVRVQFVDQASGEATGAAQSIPVAYANVKNLELLLNALKNQENDKVPYRFTFSSSTKEPSTSIVDIAQNLYHSVLLPGLSTTEDVLTLSYAPQAVFRVRVVTRCASSIAGHGASILATSFSPLSSSRLASGSGDNSARIWDTDTGTPLKTLKGHTGWVLAVSWHAQGALIATGSMDNTVRVWDAQTGECHVAPLKGHSKWITALAWQPFHLQEAQRPRVASASKDTTVRVWDVVRGITEFTLTRHTSTVSCVRWGATGHIYSSSHDKTIKIWDGKKGALLHNLTAHTHWVNHLALSTDFVLRTGYFDHTSLPPPPSDEQQRSRAEQRLKEAATHDGRLTERLVSASDDCTIFLWDTLGETPTKPVARLLGHQKQVNHVTFSPDGHYIASCGFDNHVKLWLARDGKFLRTLRGHVAPVYQCCFSSDSRLLVSASKDTTLKAWDVRTGKMVEDLPGHKDEVYAVDWSPDGKRVGSGGKDKLIKIWSN